MTILHRNKHDPKHGSRVPQTTRDTQRLRPLASKHGSFPTTNLARRVVAVRLGCFRACGGNAPVLEKLAVVVKRRCRCFFCNIGGAVDKDRGVPIVAHGHCSIYIARWRHHNWYYVMLGSRTLATKLERRQCALNTRTSCSW